MAHPVSSLGRAENSNYRDRISRPGFSAWAGCLVLACLSCSLPAAEWDGSARLAVTETYTDNLRLSADDEEHESITEINPGFSLTGQGARLKLSADYTMQNLFYAQNSGENKTYHQLEAGEQSELIEDWFYFDSSAAISQQQVSVGDQLPLDNLNPSSNRSDVVALQVEPYLKRDLGAFASTELRYSHGWVDYDSGASDAESSVASGYIANGHGATHLFWRFGYRLQKDMRDTNNDSERRSSDGMIRYRMLSTLSLVAHGGREENEILTNRPSSDGSYWSAGFQWHPGPKFSLEATKGENDEQGRLIWTPSSRTSVNIGYQHRDVGLNTGVNWDGQISHRTRRSTWALSYSEEVTNVQVLQLRDPSSLILLDEERGIALDPETGAFVPINSFELTDEEFLRARAQGSVSYRTGKSTVSLSLFDETRTYELSGNELFSQGGSASWAWRFGVRTTSLLSVQAQRYEVLNNDDPANSVKASLGVNRVMSSHADAGITLSHHQGELTSTNAEYDENRVSIHLNMNF